MFFIKVSLRSVYVYEEIFFIKGSKRSVYVYEKKKKKNYIKLYKKVAIDYINFSLSSLI